MVEQNKDVATFDRTIDAIGQRIQETRDGRFRSELAAGAQLLRRQRDAVFAQVPTQNDTPQISEIDAATAKYPIPSRWTNTLQTHKALRELRLASEGKTSK